MYISSAPALSSLLALLTTTIPSLTTATRLHLAPRTTPSKTPQLTYLFTVTVNVGTVLLPPITIPGGTRLVEPLTSGSISGPYLNATVKGGVAYPTVVDGGAVQIPEIVIYGTTTTTTAASANGMTMRTTTNNGTMMMAAAEAEGENYFAIVEGIGGTREQESGLRLEIGGPYAQLNSTFIVADIRRNGDGTVVTVDGFGVM